MSRRQEITIALAAPLAAFLFGAGAALAQQPAPAQPAPAQPAPAQPAPAAKPTAANLDQLLQQTRNARLREDQENKAREARFLSDRNAQAGLLAQARAEKAAQEARSVQLSAQFDANEKQLTELQAVLDAKAGNLGEMFGVVRQVSGDVSSVLYNSVITVQYPERDAVMAELGAAKDLPSIEKLEGLWYEMQREMTESGRVVRFNTKVVEPDGASEDTEVVRIGAFNAVSEDGFLNYLPSIKALTLLPRQPDDPYPDIADGFFDEDSGYEKMVVDPTRGVMLSLYVQRPTILERIEQGELVGYIIITVGVVGAVLAIYQFFYLLGVSRRVKRQLANINQPVTDNPLGRVLATFKGDAMQAEKDAEVVELRISEAVLKEVPPLERFQAFLRLAVAAGPLLGLVGTVIGMIITFQSITESGGGDPKLMAAGISQAMIATVLGLGIAIPLLFINAALQSRSKAIVQVLDEQSTGLLAERLEAQRA